MNNTLLDGEYTRRGSLLKIKHQLPRSLRCHVGFLPIELMEAPAYPAKNKPVKEK